MSGIMGNFVCYALVLLGLCGVHLVNCQTFYNSNATFVKIQQKSNQPKNVKFIPRGVVVKTKTKPRTAETCVVPDCSPGQAVQIDYPSRYGSSPFDAIVLLEIVLTGKTSNTDRYYQCSGFSIDPWHIVTAGHCSYVPSGVDNDPDGNVINEIQAFTSGTAYFGYNNGNTLYGNIGLCGVAYFNEWANNIDFGYDISVYQLCAPTQINDWIKIADPDLLFNNHLTVTGFTNVARVIGYPAGIYSGQVMYDSWGRFGDYLPFSDTECLSCTICGKLQAEVQPGSSGSPIIDVNSGYAIGVMSHFCCNTCPVRYTPFNVNNDITILLNVFGEY